MIDATAVEHPPASSPQVELKLILVPCPLCGEDEAEPVAVGSDLAHGTTSDGFLAVRCGGCELVYLRPRPAAEERLRLYPPSYFSPSDARSRPERRRAHAIARRMVRACPSPPPNARLLEVGYGARLHLGELRRCGPRTWVLEVVTPHETLARAGRSEGFIVYPGRGRALEDRGAIYDVVFLLHALEHCESPLEELRSLRRLIRPGGRLILLTENADSAVGRVFRGRHWAGYDFPRHLSLMGARTLRRLAAATGFEVERLSTVKNSQMWVHSTTNLLRDWNAPSWLIRHVQHGGLLLGAVASLAESVAQFRAQGAQLQAILRKPGDIAP